MSVAGGAPATVSGCVVRRVLAVLQQRKISRHADKIDRERRSLCSRNDSHLHAVVRDAAMAGPKRESLANVFAGGSGIEEKARFSWVHLLRKVKSERRVRNGFGRVLDEPRLAERGHPLLTIIGIAVRQPRPSQQRRRVARLRCNI